MSGIDPAKYRFVPYARRGYRSTDEFSEGKLNAGAQPSFGVEVTPKGKSRDGKWTDGKERSLSLSMYGPGDVQGVDDGQIVRVEPEPDTAEFQPNYFPFVEFDRTDLPWMFSPERGDESGRIRPWLTLIVVTDEVVDVSIGDARPCPVLELQSAANLKTELPDLRESWAWAHVQVHGTPKGESGSDWYGSGTEPTGWLYEELQETSNLTVSRIMAPRNLKPQTDYVACLVPTFETGRLAGLGEDPYGEDGRKKAGTAEFAWKHGDLPETPFELPLYHYWRFTSGRAGTFENLVRDLSPVELGEDVGSKDVDVRDPGPDALVPGENESPSVDVGGAMYSIPARRSISSYERDDELRQLLNKPETLPGGDSEDAKFPIVGPPLYGQWHAGLEGIPAEEDIGDGDYDPKWFRQLNLNVRNRVAASVGGGVVQDYQEQLMDAAWEVVGKVREANKFTRSNQGAGAVGEAIEIPDRFGIGTEEEVGEPEVTPGKVRREFDRMREIADVAAAGGLDGVKPEGPLGEGDGAIGEGEGPPTAGGGDAVDTPAAGGDGTVDPVDAVSLGGATGRRTTGTEVETLPSAYANVGQTVSKGGLHRPDGGTATVGPNGSDQLTDTAAYTEYLRTFLSQPETSLQFQRLTRLDGPLAKRTDLGTADYRRAMARASYRAKLEVDSIAEGALEPPSTDSTGDGEGSSALGEGMLIDPDTIASMGEGAPGDGGSDGDPGPKKDDSGFEWQSVPEDPDGKTSSEGTQAGTGPVPDLPESGGTQTPDSGAVAPSEWLSRRPTAVLPKTRTLETKTASAAALDERVAGVTVDQPGGGVSERDTGSATGLISGILDHCGAVEERIDSARSALGESPGPASAPALAAYEAARPIAYSLDPLDRTLSKALADPDVEVADPMTEERKDDEMADLRAAYRDLLAALTAAYEALSGESTSDGHGGSGDGAAGDSGPNAPGGSDGGRSDRGGSGMGGSGGDARDDSVGDGARSDSGRAGRGSGKGEPASDHPGRSLDDAERALGRIRGVLDGLEGLLSPHRSVSMPAATLPDPTGSTLGSYAPTSGSSYQVSMEGIGAGLRAGSEARFRKTMLSRRLSFVDTEAFVRSDDPVEKVMVAPEFPTPTWRLLKEYDEEFLLPGADSVPPDSVGLVVQNREFIESYMVGLSHEMGRELLWRRYPTDKRGTYFRRFWNRGKGPAWDPGSAFRVDETVPSKDITEIHEWDTNELGVNAPGQTGTDKVVLLVRGKLFDRYPNTVVYAARAKVEERNGELVVEPVTPEKFVKNADYDPGNVKFPVFRGEINADTTFLGFDLTYPDVYANQEEIETVVEGSKQDRDRLLRDMANPDSDRANDLGWYFVFEERPGETRFGLDEGEKSYSGNKPATWDDLSWYHTVGSPGKLDHSYLSVGGSQPEKKGWSMGSNADEWGKNSAHMAGITWQKPVRISYHAHEMLPDGNGS